jgi:dTDP-glucose pyrophosphorylase
MIDWEKTLVPQAATIRQAMAAIEHAGAQIGLVVDTDKRLLGTVTDGDIRRAILGSAELADPVLDIMHQNPTVAQQGSSRQTMLETMQTCSVRQLPVLDAEGSVVDLKLLDELLAPEPRDNWVVLQAGGLGTRLRPLTSETPKPMLKVGKRPILETILLSFRNAGFRRFYMSVNYKRERIKEHFGDGSAFDVSVRYLEEESSLGTAGALGLLPEVPTSPVIVMNADLLTSMSFGSLVDFHVQSGAPATICVREYDVQIPFGVVEVESASLVRIREKPVHTFFVNAGVYVLDPLAIELVPKGERFDMPQLFERLLEAGKKPAVFPIREYWLDIGRVDDFVKANLEYDDVFE